MVVHTSAGTLGMFYPAPITNQYIIPRRTVAVPPQPRHRLLPLAAGLTSCKHCITHQTCGALGHCTWEIGALR